MHYTVGLDPFIKLETDQQLPIVPNDPENDFPADCILEQQGRGQNKRYLVRWACRDPNTGRRYENEWIKASGANAELEAEWIDWRNAHPGQSKNVGDEQHHAQRAPKRKYYVIDPSDSSEGEGTAPEKHQRLHSPASAKRDQSANSGRLPSSLVEQSERASSTYLSSHSQSNNAAAQVQSSPSVYIEAASPPKSPCRVSVWIDNNIQSNQQRYPSSSSSGSTQRGTSNASAVARNIWSSRHRQPLKEKSSQYGSSADLNKRTIIPDSQSYKESAATDDLHSAISQAPDSQISLSSGPNPSKATQSSPFRDVEDSCLGKQRQLGIRESPTDRPIPESSRDSLQKSQRLRPGEVQDKSLQNLDGTFENDFPNFEGNLLSLRNPTGYDKQPVHSTPFVDIVALGGGQPETKKPQDVAYILHPATQDNSVSSKDVVLPLEGPATRSTFGETLRDLNIETPTTSSIPEPPSHFDIQIQNESAQLPLTELSGNDLSQERIKASSLILDCSSKCSSLGKSSSACIPHSPTKMQGTGDACSSSPSLNHTSTPPGIFVTRGTSSGTPAEKSALLTRPHPSSRRQSPAPTSRGQRSRASSPQLPDYPPFKEQDVQTIIPLPLFKMPLVHYKNQFEYERDFLEKFISTAPEQVTEDQKQHAKELSAVLSDFTLHQDLIGEQPFTQLSQGGYGPKQLAQWSVTVSSKFRFLSSLFEIITALNVQRTILICVKPGLPLKYVKDFLQGSDVTYQCPLLENSAEKNSPVTVYLQSTQHLSDFTIDDLDLIVGLDETFRLSDPDLQRLRRPRTNLEMSSTPIIGLCVPLTMEHMLRENEASTDTLESLQSLLLCACQQRAQAGQNSKHIADPAATAKHLAEAMHAPTRPFFVPSISQIQIPSLEGPSSQGLIDSDQTQGSSSVAPIKTKKRSAPDSSPIDQDIQHAKRQRASPSPNPPEATLATTEDDSTRVTDSANKHTDKTVSPISSHHGSLRDRIENLQTRLATLRAENLTLQRAVDVYRPQQIALYTENKELKNIARDFEALQLTSATLNETNIAQRQQIREQRQRITQLESTLAGSSDPDVAELGQLRETAREVEVLKKKLTSKDKDLTYIRDLYQEASNAATENTYERDVFAKELETLRPRLEAAEATERVALKRESNAASANRMQNEIAKLRRQLKDRDAENDALHASTERLARENEDLKERVGMGLHTRRAGSAQPGSRAASAQPGGREGARMAQGGVAMGRQLSGQGGVAMGRQLSGQGGVAMGRQSSNPGGRASSDLLRAAASHVVKTAGGSRNGSRQGSRQGSPGPKGRRSKLGQ
ncbi:MAG: hypothetical protein Q9162_007544 [Coniocarpon cinnabarinum]